MQIPESWLREFCDPPLSTQQLADVLTMGGLEVEDVRSVAPPFTKVVVGEIRSARQHPNADRLRVCEVDAGQGALLSIVCGAPNARAGIRVPCALVGAELPPGEDGRPFVIKTGKLRGVESQGMLCSARELRLSDDHGGLLELDSNAPVGADVREWLALDDAVFTLKLTPNLGHALSVYGVARELAALTGAPLNEPRFDAVPPATEGKLPVRISAPDLCGRFSGRIVRGVDTQAKTPAWMVQRLERCGQRSVTALVDISNYVMFELGRPSHIFDLDRIHGGLEVRWGHGGETLKLLNGNTVTVDEKVGVIADDREAESLAGVMGGDATAVSDQTRNVYVEAAFWWPQAIAGRSRRFNFSTDAGHRFERGVDASTTVEHIERITKLILEICGGQPGPMDDTVARMPERAPVHLRAARAAKVIGMPITAQDCAEVFRRLRMECTQDDLGVAVTPPAYRFDIVLEEDLIEEVARMIGYGRLPDAPPVAPIVAQPQPESRRGPFAVRRQLAALGYQETINFSFVEEAWERELAGNADPIRLLNPIAAPLAVMRSSLLGSLLQALRFNVDRKADRVRLFEVGRVFRRDPSVPASDVTVRSVDQPMRVAGVLFGSGDKLQWNGRREPVDFYDAKGDVEALLSPSMAVFEPAVHPALHPGRSARVLLGGKPAGWVGELHPRWRQKWGLPMAPMLFELDLTAVLARDIPAAGELARQQAVQRDIAVIVREDVSHARLMAAIHAADTGGVLRDAVLFDVYRPTEPAAGMVAGEKSLAVRLTLNSDASTLAEEQIDTVCRGVVQALEAAVGARLRH